MTRQLSDTCYIGDLRWYDHKRPACIGLWQYQIPRRRCQIMRKSTYPSSLTVSPCCLPLPTPCADSVADPMQGFLQLLLRAHGKGRLKISPHFRWLDVWCLLVEVEVEVGGGGTPETQKLIPSKTGEEPFLPSVFRQSDCCIIGGGMKLQAEQKL